MEPDEPASDAAQTRAALEIALATLRARVDAVAIRRQLEASLATLAARLSAIAAAPATQRRPRVQARRPGSQRHMIDMYREQVEETYSNVRLGEDPVGCTHVRQVARLQAAFKAWNLRRERGGGTPRQHRGSYLQVTADVRGGEKKAVKFIADNKVKLEQADSRLSLLHTYYCHGLKPTHVRGHGRLALSALERLRYFVGLMPECLHVPEDSEHGEYFEPVHESWLESADQHHGWTQPLTALITSRITGMYVADLAGLIAGARESPQPRGRYLNFADYIQRWNASCGKCVCGRDIFLGAEDSWPKNGKGQPIPPEGAFRASVQRLDPMVMHLEWNCAPTLVCSRCDCHTQYNDRYMHDGSTHPCV